MLFNPRSAIRDPRSRIGGPRCVRFLPILDSGFDDGFDGGLGRGSFDIGRITPIAPPPPSPSQVAQELAGGLTPTQVDQLARFETQEGAPIVIPYGELLIAGNLVAHKFTVGPPKKNEFTVVLGEGWGGLGSHGEWEGIVTAWWSGEALTRRWDYTIWFDDALPFGAVQQNDTDGWNWITTNPTPYFGKYTHQSPNKAGQHQHFFTDATQTMSVGTGDVLNCWIWIDPANPPQEVMLQWQDGSGSFEHRAYWGANLIGLGTNGTNSRRQISASIPATGQWVPLQVAASQVGLEGQTVKGMAFTLFDGAATWDQAARWKDEGLTSPGYVFRPGVISPAIADVQQVFNAGLIPTGLAYSGSANIFVRLTEQQSAEDRPDKFRCRAKCRRTFDFDATGQEIGYGYSVSPARVAADRILAFFQRIYRDRLATAQEKFRARVFWPSWVDWKNNSAQLIPWNKDGTGNIFIPRFEAHIFFAQDTILADALDQITGLSATMWQDDGEQLIFLPPGDRAPVHHFNESNIAGPPRITPVDARERPNRFIANFRETDDQFLGKATVEPPDNTFEDRKRNESIDRVGEIRSEREFPNMRQSQAQRVLEYRARLEHDNPIFCSLTGDGTSIHVLPGDFVTVTHPIPKWDHQLCLVVEITVRSNEELADEVEFVLQKIDGPLYDDTAHRPIQPAIALP